MTRLEVRHAERLRSSLAAGHGIVIAPNHSRDSDPLVLGALSKAVGRHFYLMASWHLFMQGRLMAWVLRRGGAFSVYREGMDRQSVNAATEILETADRPLVLFPEGFVSRTNDRLSPLLEGLGVIARSAARKRASRRLRERSSSIPSRSDTDSRGTSSGRSGRRWRCWSTVSPGGRGRTCRCTSVRRGSAGGSSR